MANTATPKFVDDAVVRRLYARGPWKLASVAHFGGDETGIADMCLLKDEAGKPFIPGASIAGAARSFLARRDLPWQRYQEGLTKESSEFKRFFGGPEKADTVAASDPMSALTVADAHCGQATTSIRDGVRVDKQSGSAADKAKFDVEIVERGTEFELNLECVIREGDKNYNLTALFLALLYGFQEGDIRLGARTRRGYGRGKVSCWEIRDLQMDNSADVMAWLRDNPWTRAKSSLTPRPLPSNHRQCLRIEADFNLCTSLLIRSSSGDPDAPDMIHLQSDGEPVVPGTSFAGAFRHRATLIAKTIGWSESTVDKMFGYVYEEGSKGTQQADARASRIWIEEHLVENAKYQWQDRVAIDRFTGGSLQSALFNEKPVYPLRLEELAGKKSTSNLRLTLTLEEPEEAEIGLLLLTLRDFWRGHAALGGETSNGRGILQGIEACLQLKRSESPSIETWKLSHDGESKRMKLNEGDVSFLECCVKKVESYANCPAGSEKSSEEKGTTDV